MNTENLPDLGFDWAEVWTMVQTTGVDFGINVVTAILIFFVGKWVVNLIVGGLMKAMQKGELDITLRRFIGNLARMLLMLFVIIAAINQLGVQTASLIALLGAAGRLPTAGRIALAVECGIQNSALGITVAVSLLSVSGLAVPSVIYAFLMNITALVLITARQLQVGRTASSGAFS